jgi:hypothetical protein
MRQRIGSHIQEYVRLYKDMQTVYPERSTMTSQVVALLWRSIALKSGIDSGGALPASRTEKLQTV